MVEILSLAYGSSIKILHESTANMHDWKIIESFYIIVRYNTGNLY